MPLNDVGGAMSPITIIINNIMIMGRPTQKVKEKKKGHERASLIWLLITPQTDNERCQGKKEERIRRAFFDSDVVHKFN